MARTERTLALNRAQALGALVFGCFAFVVVILSVVLGLTGVMTFMSAALLAIFGGIFGGLSTGLLVGGAFYVVKMWTSTSWGISSKP